MVKISQRKREKSYNDQNQKPDKELLEQFEQLREILVYEAILHEQFQPESFSYSNMGNRDKDKEQHSDAEAMGEGGESAAAKEACNAHQASRDLSCERAAAIDKLVVEAVRR